MNDKEFALSGFSSTLVTAAFPLLSILLTRGLALGIFDRSGNQIIESFRALTPRQKVEPIAIPGRLYPETVQKNWSPVRILKHLELVNEAAGEIIEELTGGKKVTVNFTDENNFPDKDGSLKDFEGSLFVFKMRVNRSGTLDVDTRHAHPRFGALKASQWLVFTSLHLWLYSRYLNALVKAAAEKK